MGTRGAVVVAALPHTSLCAHRIIYTRSPRLFALARNEGCPVSRDGPPVTMHHRPADVSRGRVFFSLRVRSLVPLTTPIGQSRLLPSIGAGQLWRGKSCRFFFLGGRSFESQREPWARENAGNNYSRSPAPSITGSALFLRGERLREPNNALALVRRAQTPGPVAPRTVVRSYGGSRIPSAGD